MESNDQEPSVSCLVLLIEEFSETIDLAGLISASDDETARNSVLYRMREQKGDQTAIKQHTALMSEREATRAEHIQV